MLAYLTKGGLRAGDATMPFLDRAILNGSVSENCEGTFCLKMADPNTILVGLK